jgi:lipoate-protein ligase B
MASKPEQLEDSAFGGGNGLRIRDCGLAEYRGVLDLQHQLQEQRREGRIGDTVLVVEHPPVVTLGARQNANRLLVSGEELTRRGVDLVEIRRGGGATAHNPGQLVFYPILHLQELRLDITQYIRRLEAIGMELLAGLGVEGGRRKGFPGLWVGAKKIASIGVRVSRCVTCHGMAINIQNDLSIFDLMVPCGLDGVEMTSVQKETGQAYDMQQIKIQLTRLLVRYVGRAPVQDGGRLPLRTQGSSHDSMEKAGGDARPARKP